MIFGIPDLQIVIGYGLAIGLAIACVVYGLLNWNSEAGEDGR
jgi:hypothetical protein